MKNILEVEDLGIMIDGEKIVKDISFFVHDQHITCIVGESGSGKSVTMSAVLGLLPKVACKTKESKIMFHGDSMFCIYQDPMNSLNSSVKVGKQLYQMAKGYKKMTRAEFDQQMGIILERIKFEDPMGSCVLPANAEECKENISFIFQDRVFESFEEFQTAIIIDNKNILQLEKPLEILRAGIIDNEPMLKTPWGDKRLADKAVNK